MNIDMRCASWYQCLVPIIPFLNYATLTRDIERKAKSAALVSSHSTAMLDESTVVITQSY